MIKLVLAATMAVFVAQPAAAAQIFDYNVYATGNTFISGGSYGDIASGSFTNANGPSGTNFTSQTGSSATLDSSADALSLQLAALAATGTASNAWGALTLTGTGNGINVFNLDGSSAPNWSSIYALSFAGPGTGAIVNVWGSSLSNFVNLNFGGLAADQVIFNFHEANSLTLGGMNVKGSVLAPAALVTIQGGSVDGSVIADRFHSEGARIGGTGFAGLPTSAPAVPEPATWAMMLMGFGVIGFALRRQRRSQPRPRIRFAMTELPN
ncbi:MAG: hypothetical protein B7Z33_13500 [Sphingomonadales bacterium 12-68-11]|nr:MAG: hypothetical protein B7Z33_13500 [Sphingomonadales bacterium 12-68-11]